MKNSADIIIIGAGISELAAGCYAHYLTNLHTRSADF
jgi:thioredoxin reductase